MNPRAENLLRGGFLREQRLRAGISAAEMAFLLDLSEEQLGSLESYDLVLPDIAPAAAQALGMRTPAQQAYALPGGYALRQWRKTRWIRQEELTRGVLSAKAALKLVEDKNWPIPPEWLPELRRRGFLQPGPNHPGSFCRRVLNVAQVEEAVRRLCGGENLQQVTYAMGVSVGALRRDLAPKGIQIPKWAKASWKWVTPDPVVNLSSGAPCADAILLLERAAAVAAAKGLPPPALKSPQLGTRKRST